LTTFEKKRSAVFTCPDCKQFGVLTEHEISLSGIVTPSVVCPTPGCNFHEMIQLQGWSAT